MKLGSILGFQISLDYSWFIVFALVLATLMGGGFPHQFPIDAPAPGFALALLGTLLLFGSVVAHELGHSVVGRRLGLRIEGITLFIFGGIARLKDEPRRPAVEFWMTAAGPAVSALLAIVFYALGRAGLVLGWPKALIAMLGYLSITNEALALFNLIPAFPLDGGRILRSSLWAWRKDVVVATRWSAYVSRLIAFALIGVGGFAVATGNLMGMWEIFIGLFVLSAATAAYEQVALRNRLEGISVASLIRPAARPIPARMPLNWVVDEYFANSDETAFPVEDGDDVRGILSLEDVMAVPQRQWAWTMAVEVCQPLVNENSIEDGEDAWQALSQMIAGNARRLLVLHDGRIRGILTRDRMMSLLEAPRRTA